MYCPKCGVLMEEDAKFCGSCGNPIDGTSREDFNQNTDPMVSDAQFTSQVQRGMPAQRASGNIAMKSPGTAALLGFLFGPFGFLYISTKDFIITLIVAVVGGAVTFGYGLPVLWIIWPFWAFSAANKWNKDHFVQ